MAAVRSIFVVAGVGNASGMSLATLVRNVILIVVNRNWRRGCVSMDIIP
jgi:hypothetical protein